MTEHLDNLFKKWKEKGKRNKRKKANTSLQEELQYLRQKRIAREMSSNKFVGWHEHKSDDFWDIH